MTPDRLAEIKARVAAATALPWAPFRMTEGGRTYAVVYAHRDSLEGVGRAAADVHIVAHLRGDVGILIDEVERLQAALHRVDRELAAIGCDCDCGCDTDGHDDGCERCAGCRIEAAMKGKTP